MKTKLNKHWVYILGIFFVSIILLLPFFLNDYLVNDDTWFHLINIGLIKNCISENFFNGFFLKILPFVGNNLGYGTRLFYPPLAHTLASYLAYFLEFFSINILDSLKIFHFLSMFFSGVTMYICANRFHKDKMVSFASSVIYMASNYHMAEIYVRDAFGENLIFIFLPLIIVSVKELLEGNKNLFYFFFVLGYVGGILSHFTMMIYITLILGVSMLFYYKKIFQKEFLVPFIKGCVLVFLLTAFFFEPMFEHKLFGDYMVYKPWVMSMGIWHTAFWGFEYLFDLPTSTMSFRFSLIVLFMLLYVFIRRKKELKDANYKLVLLFGIFSFWLSTRYFPWFFMPYTLFMIQFGWRLVSLVIFFVALISSLALKNCHNKLVLFLVIGGIICSSLFSIPDNHREVLLLNEPKYAALMGWQKEYLPVAIGDNEENLKYFEERDESILVESGNGRVNIIDNSVPYLKFEVISNDELTLELPRIFYFGYVLKDDDKNSYPLFENERGFLSTNLNSGIYTLDFEGSNAYKICLFISLTTLLGISCYGIFLLGKKWMRRKL